MKPIHNLKMFSLTALLCCMFFAVSCSQEPIFFAIEQEIALRDSSVEGLVSSIEVSATHVYASNGNLYRRTRTNSKWHSVSKPAGVFRIAEVATDGTNIYVLGADSGWRPYGVWRLDEGTMEWTEVTNTPSGIQRIGSGGARIYAFTGKTNGTVSVYTTSDINTFNTTAVLTDAGLYLHSSTSSGNYFATKTGVYNNLGTLITGAPASGITGIATAVIDSNPHLYVLTSSEIHHWDGSVWAATSHNAGTTLGMTALVTTARNLLLINTTTGYYEAAMDNNGDITATFTPGKNPVSSVPSSASSQYENSIGMWNINRMAVMTESGTDNFAIFAGVLNRRYGGLWAFFEPIRREWNRE